VRAAYGLRLVGLDGGGLLPTAAGEAWPEVRIEQVGSDEGGGWHLGLGGRRACFSLPGGRLRVERERARMTITTDAPLPEDLLVHPWLTAGAAVFARWHLRDAFHGGAVTVDGRRAWAVFAPKEGGKSTLLAGLAMRGVAVISDDLLVIEDGNVYAGARCVDLREGTAERLGLRELDLVRQSSRERLALGPVPPRLPLSGVAHLAWADELAVVRVPVHDRIERLRAQNALGTLPPLERGLLGLLALPTLELRRPRDLGGFQASIDALLDAIG
jgi:hypothetical protein